MLTGEGDVGRYIYMGYLNSSYSIVQTAFKPASGVIFTGAPNGMRLITNKYFSLTTGGLETANERIRVAANGFIGIGTSNPLARLHLSSGENDLSIFWGSNSSGFLSDRFNRVILRNLNGQQSWMGIEGSAGNAVGYLGIEHWQDTSPSVSLSWNKNGDVGIGTTTPDAKLTVKGNIHTQEVKVDLNGAVAPDFVFAEGYELKTLAETEEYIQKHKHLPEIPSAKEMEENGIKLKEMNLKLLQKIEEPTLYIINQQKEIKTLKEKQSLWKRRKGNSKKIRVTFYVTKSL